MMKCEKAACDIFFSEYPNFLDFNEILKEFLANQPAITVWEPFEKYDEEYVTEKIQELQEYLFNLYGE